jgi:MFS family permease
MASFMDAFVDFFWSCRPKQGLRVDREVLVVLAKAAGLTGTKLDPNGADLAAKMMGIGLCLFAAALDFICSAIAIVAIPFFVRSTEGGKNYMVGFCVGAYYGGQVLGNPIVTAISDRFGRRSAIILCLAGQAGGYALQGLAGTVGPDLNIDALRMLMIARAITGVFGSTRPLVQQYIEDVATRAERPRFLALLTAAITVGQIVGFGLGAGMYQFSPRTPMLLCCVIMGFSLLLAFAFLDEPAMFDSWERKMRALQAVPHFSEQQMTEEEDDELDQHDGPELSERGKDRQLKAYSLLCQLMYGCCFIHTFTAMGFTTLFALFILDKFQFGALQFGFILMGYSVFVAFSQVVFFSLFLPRGGKHVCAVLGFVFASVGLFLIPLATDDVAGTLMCMIPVAIGYAFVAPSMQVLLARYSSSKKRSEALLYASIAKLVGMFLGPICFAALHQANRKHPLETPFFVCGSVTVIGMILMIVIIQENAMLPEHKEHENEPNYELNQVAKLGKMIAIFLFIPYQFARTGFGVYMLTTQWDKENGCSGVLFQVYVSLAVCCVVLVRWVQVAGLVSFLLTVIGLVAINVSTRGSHRTCPDTIWEEATNIDLVVIYVFFAFFYMFFVSAFRRAEGFAAKVVRMVSMPINLARVVLGVLLCIYYYGTKMQPAVKCSGEGAKTARDWYTTYVLLSMFTFLFTVQPRALHVYHTMKAIVGFVALFKYKQCDDEKLWWFVAFDTGITISINGLFFCVEASMRYARSHRMDAREYAKFVAGHVIGIPLALARLVFGYTLCILDWDVDEAGCGEELWMYKMYVILAMFTFVPVVNTKLFGLYSVLLTILGIFTLLKYKGCHNWHLFVEVDMYVGVAGATIVYIVWVFVLDHPAIRGAGSAPGDDNPRRLHRDYGQEPGHPSGSEYNSRLEMGSMERINKSGPIKRAGVEPALDNAP